MVGNSKLGFNGIFGTEKLNTDSTTYKKPTAATEVGAGVVGVVAGSVVNGIVKSPNKKIVLSAFKEVKSENYSYEQKVLDTFEASGLKDNGITLVKAQNLTREEIRTKAESILPGWVNKGPEKLKKFLTRSGEIMINSIRNGYNAMFTPKSKEIYINTDKLAAAGFHEMGHAKNFSKMGFGKILAKTRKPGAILGTIAFYISALKPKKAPNETAKNPLDKVTTFVKNNPATTIFACFAPLLLEEGLASVKGAKLAKPVLSNRAFKNLNKMNAKAWMTYALSTVAFSCGAKAASLVHDRMASPKKIKNKPIA